MGEYELKLVWHKQAWVSEKRSCEIGMKFGIMIVNMGTFSTKVRVIKGSMIQQ